MRWLLQNIPLLVFVFIVFNVVRAVRRAQELNRNRDNSNGESEEQRRVREIQERIRRIAAERRGQSGPVPAAPPPLVREFEAPARPLLPAPPRVPPVDPFGGPMGRLVRELERRTQSPAGTPPPAVLAHVETARAAEVARQEQLAEQLRALEEQRLLTQRRAAHLAEAKAEDARTEAALRATARPRLLEDLRDPQSLRRAFVLREVLGTPVGLR